MNVKFPFYENFDIALSNYFPIIVEKFPKIKKSDCGELFFI